MRIAVPVFDSRISPVLDFSTHLEIFEIENDRITENQNIEFHGHTMLERINFLKDAGVEALICAGLCQEMQYFLKMSGIKVYAGIIGRKDDVLKAFVKNELDHPRFKMPGCCRMRHSRRSRKSGYQQKERITRRGN
ncbi:MAG: hypothetical protein A2161_14170 [Candidatus Schekmanbacteria bacterium RBG_13_48_7]|uniref:Dinitrogenase iron-molybdenum cofactor biosynthesis domain-containing protein n=1 Tax=Candidatus Schekmanbacteria bacterium RBG_13_48_7 TaxID=1817878 RepID=A0A1F7S007_9BACT|nr:MAG: hypothetical protein A2161_14170 [Candidatus Schekmanbacteria bacterium RBG_13_48_7]